MKILFIINGDYVDIINDNFLKQYDKIVCVDGGLNNFLKIKTNILPDYLIGDFDSININLLNNYKDKSIIVKKDNQDESDLLFALKYITNTINNIDEIDISCAIGNRIDHNLCNILALKTINKKIKSKIIGNNSIIYLLQNDFISINVELEKTISLIPLTNIKNISTHGLKWELNNIDLKFGFINGISNISKNNIIDIKIDYGECLIIVNNNI